MEITGNGKKCGEETVENWEFSSSARIETIDPIAFAHFSTDFFPLFDTFHDLKMYEYSF